ncbi:MAG TPA: DUF2188 domain-containing protein [Planctomycetota bacterium]|nr:DUF2188 domain-containing protein [Planctomycetota bacterium]
MTTRPVHQVFVDEINGHWRVSGEKDVTIFGSFDNKEHALDLGRRLAKKEHGQLIVRHPDETLEFAEDFASEER